MTLYSRSRRLPAVIPGMRWKQMQKYIDIEKKEKATTPSPPNPPTPESPPATPSDHSALDWPTGLCRGSRWPPLSSLCPWSKVQTYLRNKKAECVRLWRLWAPLCKKGLTLWVSPWGSDRMQSLLYDANAHVFILAVNPLENLHVFLADQEKNDSSPIQLFVFNSKGFALRYLKWHIHQLIMQIEK